MQTEEVLCNLPALFWARAANRLPYVCTKSLAGMRITIYKEKDPLVRPGLAGGRDDHQLRTGPLSWSTGMRGHLGALSQPAEAASWGTQAGEDCQCTQQGILVDSQEGEGECWQDTHPLIPTPPHTPPGNRPIETQDLLMFSLATVVTVGGLKMPANKCG